MFEKITTMLLLVLFTGESRAEPNQDPTFNGIVAGANCNVRNVTHCEAASCEQIVSSCGGTLCGTLWIDLKSKNYSFKDHFQALNITEISPAELGKKLWVRFQVHIDGDLGEGKLTLKPILGGGFKSSVVVYLGAGSAERSLSLINLDCEYIPSEP